MYINFQTCMHILETNLYRKISDLSLILIFIYSNIQPIDFTGNIALILIESETNRK